MLWPAQASARKEDERRGAAFVRGEVMNWKLLLLGAVLAALLWVSGQRDRKPELEVTILHTNDVHAHYEASASGGGAARLATAITEARRSASHSLLLDAGDEFQGTLLFTAGGPELVADVMNRLGYDAMTVGNHEFDLGPAALASFIAQATFPVLGANIDAAPQSILDGRIRPFDVFLFDGEVVGIFGLTTESTATASSPGKDITFEPVVRRARSIIESLERQGVNKIIALTHLGYGADLALAASVEGIDVIVGGHSHTKLDVSSRDAPYPTWVTSSSGDPVVVVTDGAWGQTLGRLDVVFDDAGRVVRASGSVVPLDSTIAEDPTVAAMLAPFVAQAQRLIGATQGSTEVDLDGDRPRVRSEETNLGDVIADAMLWKTRSLGTRAALMNGGGIRASISQGSISMGQVLEVLPFGNCIEVVTLTGAALSEALENGVSQVEAGAGRFPQVGGLRFTFEPAAPSGSRIRQVELWDTTTQAYRAVAPDEHVILATNDFLADGGDGYAALAEGADRYDTGWLLSDTLAEYIQAMSPLRIGTEGRILRASST